MIRKGVFLSFLLLSVFTSLGAQGLEWGNHHYIIRGEVYVDLEPIYAGHIDEEYPLDKSAAGRRALEESALFYSAMIFGWTFSYVPGERARRINENIDLDLIDSIQFGDPALYVTDTFTENMRLKVWTDYHLSESHQRRISVWRTGTIRNAQATGYSPSYLEEYPGWLEVKKMALEDAARAALRAMLRGSERNRPREVTGFISLASFPRFYIDAGRWAASARFRVQVTEVIPFAAY